MSELDSRFGIAIEPIPNFTGVAVYAWEQTCQPSSLTRLEPSSARRLMGLMEEIRKKSATGNVLVADIIVIWVVDERGDTWFAVEEMFFNGLPTGRPKYQTFEPTADIPKLGHPALISAQKGRIGGEIYFDLNAGHPVWVINKRSGRYGRHPSRTFRHLQNAANEFRAYGIELETEN